MCVTKLYDLTEEQNDKNVAIYIETISADE